jgi:hypothetical protein
MSDESVSRLVVGEDHNQLTQLLSFAVWALALSILVGGLQGNVKLQRSYLFHGWLQLARLEGLPMLA